ncbi:MAG: alanine racemase [bacterium]
MTDHPTRAVIDIAALSHNLKVIRDRIGQGRRLLAVVKANAYGHGALKVSNYLQKMGVDMLGVAYTEEGVALRKVGISLPILVMAGTLPEQIEIAIESDLILAISDMDTIRALSDMAFRMKRNVKIHIKIDTGMGRLGFRFENAVEAIVSICSLPNVTIEGIFTHLSTSEESDHSYTHYQTSRFRQLVESVSSHFSPLPILHMGNSAAVIQHPETYFDMVRVGIMLYGLAPVPELQKKLPICPILSLKTRIIHIKNASKGSSLSYGRSYICQSDKTIAVIPIGYSDGLARCMSGRIHVLIRGVKVPVVGTICMDMALIDITGLEGIRVGDEVVLIGSHGEESITAHDWASWQGTIPYEILCAIGPRVPRIYQ